MRKTNAFYVRRDGNPFPFPRSRIRPCRSALRRCTSAGAIPKSLPASCPETPPCGKTSGTSRHGAEKYMRNAAATCIFAPRSKPPKRPGARGTTAASGPCAALSMPRRAWAGASVPLGTGKPPCSPARPSVCGTKPSEDTNFTGPTSSCTATIRPCTKSAPAQASKKPGSPSATSEPGMSISIGEMRDMPRKAKPPKAGKLLRKDFPPLGPPPPPVRSSS